MTTARMVVRLPPAGFEGSLSAIASAFFEKVYLLSRPVPACGRPPEGDDRYIYALLLPSGEIRSGSPLRRLLPDMEL
jgi:hypothetical protein